MARAPIGIWLIGAKGGVATTVIVGLVALRKGLAESVGLVSELPEFSALDLADWSDLVIGGHDIRPTTLVEEAEKLHNESRVIDAALLENCREELKAVEANICAGTLVNVGPRIKEFADPQSLVQVESPRAAVERIQTDLSTFIAAHKLERLVVVNVASTEPAVDVSQAPDAWPEFEKLLDADDCPLPASTLYAIAALELGQPYINFTPSLGSALPALDDLAVRRETCHMGRDGKTGETLLKSTLAPMFAHRNLQVMSWVGHNIFGNLDGKVLDDPANKASKVTSKDKLLGEIFGYDPQTLVSIEYVASLGDWKTAWDHIHFRGFLGTPMTLQFTWQGCDSLLAAPLVLDLTRFAELAHRRGEQGTLSQLGCFFKSPQGSNVHDFALQHQALLEWTRAPRS
jgi:myo-inositol-1-phosphate synthase